MNYEEIIFDEMVSMYENGSSMWDIAKAFDMTEREVRDILCE